MVGGAFPDMAVYKHGRVYLVEIKIDTGALSTAQADFAFNWHGAVFVVRNTADVVMVYNKIRSGLGS